MSDDVLMASADAMKRGGLAIWTVYDRPRDHPGGYIARLHEVHKGRVIATEATLTGELEEIRKRLWGAGLMKLSRNDEDEPHIIESWL